MVSKLVDGTKGGIALGNTILEKSLKCLRDENLNLDAKILIGRCSFTTKDNEANSRVE